MASTSQNDRWLAIEVHSRSRFAMAQCIATRWCCCISYEVDWTLALPEAYTKETKTLNEATSAGEETYVLQCCEQEKSIDIAHRPSWQYRHGLRAASKGAEFEV